MPSAHRRSPPPKQWRAAALLLSAWALIAGRASTADPPSPLTAPAQESGLPYTRSARAHALAEIHDQVAVFPGSRYAYVQGHQVRLDDMRWRDEAMLRDGVLYVPAAFAAMILVAPAQFDSAPSYLAERWVFTAVRPAVVLPAAVRHLDIHGGDYVALADLAASAGLILVQGARGLALVGHVPPDLSRLGSPAYDSIITLFDTPEKFADPAIATAGIPALHRQGAWTVHAAVTPAQLALLEGEETAWPTAAASTYDLSGFDATLLGSAVPPPGVYPRILFSAADLPAIITRVHASAAGKMALIEMKQLFATSWWDPATSDGTVFGKLASGNIAGLEWDAAPGTPACDYPQQFKGQKPGIFNSHIAYVPECLTTMALYCLLTGDTVHGRQAAAAIASYYRLREPLIDAWSAISDSEFGSSYAAPDGHLTVSEGKGGATNWRAMHGLVAHMDLGLSLDFSGMWMTAAEKEDMRRIIAKATYGRRGYGQDAPVRFRDVNWVGWDLPHLLALAAIEGLEGFDREAWESNRDTVRAFCDWGIDDHGVIYESNGKTPGSLQFITLSMVALARRGENLFGHPHWRQLLTAQAQLTSPTGMVTVNSGTQYAPFSRQPLSYQLVDELKSFYPHERIADYLLGQARQLGQLSGSDEGTRMWNLEGFSADTYQERIGHLQRVRLPSPTYPGFVRGVLYDADTVPTQRTDLPLALDFSAPVHGAFSSSSDRSTQATWINMLVRPDHYLGAGHHHADSGMLHLSSLGVDWFTQSPFSQAYDGKYYTLVQVDGHSEAESMLGIANGYNGAATYLGMTATPDGACASADLTYAYSWRWLTQPPQEWSAAADAMGWELDPSPGLMRIWAGTARYKLRPWWAHYTYSNYIPTLRAPFNPMRYVFRTAGLVRGPHPYAFVCDDLRKDDQPHRYDWVAMLNGGVWRSEIADLPVGWAVLGFGPSPGPAILATPDAAHQRSALVAQPGEPLLLVVPVGIAGGTQPHASVETSFNGPAVKPGRISSHDQVTIGAQAVAAAFRVLLIPLHRGEPLPAISVDTATSTARIAWTDQADAMTFAVGDDQRTRAVVTRGGMTILNGR